MTSPHGLCRIAPVRTTADGTFVDWDAGRHLTVRALRHTPLTGRQQNIVDFIDCFMAGRGYAPSLREIAAAVGLQSSSSVRYQLGELAAKGVLELSGDLRQPRSLRLLQGGEVA